MHVKCKYSTLIQNSFNTDREIIAFINNFKAAVLQMLKKIKQKIKLTVNTGQVTNVCSVEKFIITDNLIQMRKLTNSLLKHRFSMHNLLRY